MIVLCCVVAVILMLLVSSVVVYVAITDSVSVKISIFGLKFKLMTDEEPKKKSQKKKSKTKKPKSAQENGKKKLPKKVDKNTFGEMVEMVIAGIKAFIKPTGRLLSRICLTHVNIKINVAAGDADQTAVEFGQTTTAIYNVLGCLRRLIVVKIKQVDIRPDFIGDESQYDISFRVRLRIYQIIGAVFGIAFKFLVNIVKNILKKK